MADASAATARPLATRAGEGYPGASTAEGHQTTSLCRDQCSPRRVREAVSDAVGGEQVARRARVWLDLPPDVLNVRIDGPFVGFEGNPADGAQQLRAGEDAARLARHGREQFELSASEV